MKKSESLIFSALSQAFQNNMSGAVDKIFDRLKARLFGQLVGAGKKITFSPKYTLQGLFMAASGIDHDKDLKDHLVSVTEAFLEAERLKAKANIAKNVQNWLATSKTKTDLVTVLGGELAATMQKTYQNVSRIVTTELNTAKNMGSLDSISRVSAELGIDDPLVYFICIHDDRLCDECKRLHLMADEITPRVWKMSELGSGYHKKGDPFPKLGGLHPHDRCELAQLPPGWGFKSGRISYIEKGHDELSAQRS